LKDQIIIVSWLLTRRCNLSCRYCGITRSVPSVMYENEMNTEFVIEGLKRLKKHNEDAFHLFYGGEPFLRPDLFEIIVACNDLDINYTIITNSTSYVYPLIMELITTVPVKGLTVSIDPMPSLDAKRKSDDAFKSIPDYMKHVEDVVAEITVDRWSIINLPKLVSDLTRIGVTSDITFLDVTKSRAYDFSNITDKHMLATKSKDVADVLQELMKGEYNVHMKEILLPEIFEALPSDFDCELVNKGVHNLTIDSDGSVRLCLRIKGRTTPEMNLLQYIGPKGELSEYLIQNQYQDKKDLCKGCNWTCPIMSKLILEGKGGVTELNHGRK